MQSMDDWFKKPSKQSILITYTILFICFAVLLANGTDFFAETIFGKNVGFVWFLFICGFISVTAVFYKHRKNWIS